MAIVYSYVRFSHGNDLKGNSKTRQKEGESWVERNGHTLSSLSLSDENTSAFRGRNKTKGDLSKFLRLIEQGRVQPGSILLVENLDRLSREQIDPAMELWRGILRAGVDIVTLMPTEMHFAQADLNDMMKIMMVMMWFVNANMESVKKSERTASNWAQLRRRIANGEQVTNYRTGVRASKLCPSWLNATETGFELDPERVEVVRHIFNRTAEGAGIGIIVQELQASFPPFGHWRWKKGTDGTRIKVWVLTPWYSYFVQTVLKDRSVLGEKQCYQVVDGAQVSTGDPVPNYYPPAITQTLWDDVHKNRRLRSRPKGPGRGLVNLWTGLTHNAHDGSKMYLEVKEEGRSKRLVSYAHQRYLPGSDPVQVDYDRFEVALLRYLTELQVVDVESKTTLQDLRAKERELDSVESKIRGWEDDMVDVESKEDRKAILTSLATLRSRKSKISEEIEGIRSALTASTPLQEAQGIIPLLLEERTPTEYRDFRLRLRLLISELIESIYLAPELHHEKVFARVQINFRNGKAKQVNVYPKGFPATGGTKTQVDISELGIDLRDREAANSVRFFTGTAKLLFPSSKDKPKTLGKVVELFLPTLADRMTPSSIVQVTRRIRRVVAFLGVDAPIEDITPERLAEMRRHFEETVSPLTARLFWERGKEILRFARGVS